MGVFLGSITLQQVYDGLWAENHSRWPGPSVSYSFPAATGAYWSPVSYGPGDEPYDPAYGALNADQMAAFDVAIFLWSRLINLNVGKVDEVIDGGPGNIRVAFTDVDAQVDDDTTAAYAYYPPAPGADIAGYPGDIWIDDSYKTADPSPGTFFFDILLHELGHAFGLKHPFEGAAMLPAEFDNTRYTVMSYTDFADSTLRYFVLDGSSLFARSFIVQPATPMVLDVAAIQGGYGAAQVAPGDSVYTPDQNSPYIVTLVDSGGIDTLNLMTHTRGSIIDLTPGAYSSIGYYSIAAQIRDWQASYPGFSAAFIADFLDKPDTYTWSNNYATSLNTVVENVLCGSGDDTVTGNSAANSISGGAGSDRLFGSTGDDTISGGEAGAAGNYIRGDEGNDSLVGGANFDDINGNMGNDTVSTGAGDDYCVGGKDNDLLSGGDDYDLVYGNLGDDTCNGDGGNDIVRGGQGNDSVSGGAGNDFVSGDKGDDTVTGGAGADVFHTFADAGLDRVLDFSLAEGDRVQLDPGTTYTVTQVGADTVIQMSAGQMVLVGVQMSSLPPGTIFGA